MSSNNIRLTRIIYGLMILVTFCLSLILNLPLTSVLKAVELSPGVPPASEIRGVWLTNVDSEVLFSTQGVKQAVDRLNQLNFNTLYPTVWQGGYTLYPSAVAEAVVGRGLDPTPGLQGRDMLEEVIETGHDQGMTVIPWFEFGFQAPADSDLASRHPEWLTKRLDETQTKLEGVHERVWLNPFHPEVQQFLLDLVSEVVENYDVDGIQMDDHFGLPSEFGYDPYTIELFKAEHDGREPPPEFYDTYWVRWRADKINDFMERLFYTVKEIKSDCIVSLSPNPLHFSLPAYLQDWFTWERKGWIEEIILQDYRTDMDQFISEMERTEVELARTHIPVAIGILSGLRNNPTPTGTIQRQVAEVRQRQFAGVSFFFYESLWNWAEDTPEQREVQVKKLFPEPVMRPRV
ncbi:MAG: glycoside hydrolase family 10 protein [Microcoleaceae cyanobacterium]